MVVGECGVHCFCAGYLLSFTAVGVYFNTIFYWGVRMKQVLLIVVVVAGIGTVPRVVMAAAEAGSRYAPAAFTLTFEEWLRRYPENKNPAFYEEGYGGQFDKERETKPSAVALAEYQRYTSLGKACSAGAPYPERVGPVKVQKMKTLQEWLTQYPQDTVLCFYRVYMGGWRGQEECVEPSPAAHAAYEMYKKSQANNGEVSFEEWLVQHPEWCAAKWVGADGEEYVLPKEGARQAYILFSAQRLQEQAVAIQKNYR